MEGITTIWSSFTFVLGHSTVHFVDVRGVLGGFKATGSSAEVFSSSSAATKRTRAFGSLVRQRCEPFWRPREAVGPSKDHAMWPLCG